MEGKDQLGGETRLERESTSRGRTHGRSVVHEVFRLENTAQLFSSLPQESSNS